MTVRGPRTHRRPEHVGPGSGSPRAARRPTRSEHPLAEDDLDPALARYTSVVTHIVTAPGTYFPAVRVTNQRSVDAGTPHCRIFNLGRVRVVVR
jgi:hypothetical protein